MTSDEVLEIVAKHREQLQKLFFTTF